MSSKKYQSKIIPEFRTKELMFGYLYEFQEILAKSYGLNAKTLMRFQYDTEAQAKVNTTNDGYAIIQGLNFSQVNPVKEAVRILLLDTARRVNLLVGDGTTTAMILTIGLCQDVISKHISIDEIEDFQEYLLEFIKDNTYTKVGKKELYNYAKIATRREKLATEIADLVDKLPVGVRPTISKEFLGMSKKNKYTIFDNSFYLSSSIALHDFFDHNKYETVLKNCFVVSTLQAVNATNLGGNMLTELVNIIATKYSSRKQDYNLLVICPDMDDNMKRWCLDFNKFTKQVLEKNNIEVNHTFKLVPIMVGLKDNHDFNKAIYEDFKALMDAKMFNNHKGETIAKSTYKDLGFAKKVTIGLKTTTFESPRSNQGLLKDQQQKVLNLLQNTEEISSNTMLNEFMARRARLALSYAAIEIGGVTEAEKHNTYKLIEDGIYGACTLKETGYIPGANALLVAGFQTYNSIRIHNSQPILDLQGMILPTLLLCENSNDPDTNIDLLAELLNEEVSDIKTKKFDYVDILNGYTIDMSKNEISHCSKNGIIDSSQMLIEVINSTFSTVKEIIQLGGFEMTEEVDSQINYDKEIDIEEDEIETVLETIEINLEPKIEINFPENKNWLQTVLNK